MDDLDLYADIAGYQAQDTAKPSPALETKPDVKPDIKPAPAPAPAPTVVAASVFISNLQWWTTDVELEGLCAGYGPVVAVRFIEDKACGKSRGMAVVDFGTAVGANDAISGLNGWGGGAAQARNFHLWGAGKGKRTSCLA